MDDRLRQMVIETLQRGEELPREWARELFPPEKRECELVYYGKDREEDIRAGTMAVPLQPVRTFGKNGDGWHNMLIFGDNLQVLKRLLEMKREGKLCNADGTPGVRLVYIDPPFATSREFRGNQDEKAYQDKITGAQFIEFLRKRLVLLKELLSEDGSLYVHLDWRKAHYMKVILDEMFGEHNFRNEIIWKRQTAHGDVGQGARHLGRLHDTILLYTKGDSYKWNQVFTAYSEYYKDNFYKYVEPDTGRKYQLGDLTAPGGASKGNPYFEFLGVTRYWRFSKERIEKLYKEGRIVQTKPNAVPRLKRYLDEMSGVPVQDIWEDIPPIQSQAKERLGYPTQKPEELVERILLLSSNQGDIALDAFAGSGTICAVAERLGRRWIAIDCGKLAIYTIQNRMLNLKTEIRNKGKSLKAKPFTLYNAGLYDFSTLRQLDWEDWRFFALQLFECKDEPHNIGGLKLDGKRRGASVLVFNHIKNAGKRIDEETVAQIHAHVGKKVGTKFYIIAPSRVFDFLQDYIDLDGVRYYAMRIPYSIINELHHQEFSALKQPSDERAVNETVDAVGFDFIQPPKVEWKVGAKKREGSLLREAFLKIKKFESRARLRSEDVFGGLGTLSMLMLDYDFDGEVFNLDAVFYNTELEANNWEARFPHEGIGEKLMAIFIDIHGNEARHVIPRAEFGLEQLSSRKTNGTKSNGKKGKSNAR